VVPPNAEGEDVGRLLPGGDMPGKIQLDSSGRCEFSENFHNGFYMADFPKLHVATNANEPKLPAASPGGSMPFVLMGGTSSCADRNLVYALAAAGSLSRA
jgi:hypothetical protein